MGGWGADTCATPDINAQGFRRRKVTGGGAPRASSLPHISPEVATLTDGSPCGEEAGLCAAFAQGCSAGC